MLQYVAVCCSALRFASAGSVDVSISHRKVLQCVAVCCVVLQCVAVCFSVLHFAFLVEIIFVWVIAVRCSVLQCVAVCCSVLRFSSSW